MPTSGSVSTQVSSMRCCSAICAAVECVVSTAFWRAEPRTARDDCGRPDGLTHQLFAPRRYRWKAQQIVNHSAGYSCSEWLDQSTNLHWSRNDVDLMISEPECRRRRSTDTCTACTLFPSKTGERAAAECSRTSPAVRREEMRFRLSLSCVAWPHLLNRT
jgi:hypothetical protein